MKHKLPTIKEVVAAQLCLGCGLCAYMCPDDIEMVDVLDEGRRPQFRKSSLSGECSLQARQACPGAALEHTFNVHEPHLIKDLIAGWGPVLQVLEGHAADQTLRVTASSGGVATALALYCIEQEKMKGVLHIAARQDIPYLNQAVFSRSKEALLAATGSRYAPASPAERLDLIEREDGASVLIGKPCDVAGAHRACAQRPALAQKIGATISVFCAGTPSSRGTFELFREMGIDDVSCIRRVRYRGMGWPGKAVVSVEQQAQLREYEMPYAAAWGEILRKYLPWRCYLCPDHTGEFADIAVGDAWHRPAANNEPGSSLIVVRTLRGVRILKGAVESGYLKIEKSDPALLPAAQPNLLRARGAVWARSFMCRLFGIAVPRYKNIPMFRVWWRHLTWHQKFRPVVSVIRQAVKRRLR